MAEPDLAEQMTLYAWEAHNRHFGGDPHPRDFNQFWIYDLLSRYRDLELSQFTTAIDEAMASGRFRGLRWFCQDFRPKPKAQAPVKKEPCVECGDSRIVIVRHERGRAPVTERCKMCSK
ncbi:MAG TPA: hypothetical protein VNH83_28205 [Bryobacteraceae bacterium]|nr:hypothetical protein [Bryobacteraceae bacterium]